MGSARLQLRQYLLITGNYWAFTITDGALRMLVVLYFHQLGYAPLQIALLFLFYEVFGIITNLFGGWLGARFGLNRTMNLGLGLQIAALGMLLVPTSMLSVVWVMAAQAISGIAKDLNKMSAKSSIKMLVRDDAQTRLYRWVAALTGSKNALKGLGFFVGGALLAAVGFQLAIAGMAGALTLVWLFSLFNLQADLGRARQRPKFASVFSKSTPINTLSAARLFLFGARDIWFVVALPVWLSEVAGWTHTSIGLLFALWIIGYGTIQAATPALTGINANHPPAGRSLVMWGLLLTLITTALTAAKIVVPETAVLSPLIAGLLLFGVVFAINSAIHSYLIVYFADHDRVSMDVGFYYMANAGGRLLGTVLSGWLYQQWGLAVCLAGSAIMLLVASIISLFLPASSDARQAS